MPWRTRSIQFVHTEVETPELKSLECVCFLQFLCVSNLKLKLTLHCGFIFYILLYFFFRHWGFNNPRLRLEDFQRHNCHGWQWYFHTILWHFPPGVPMGSEHSVRDQEEKRLVVTLLCVSSTKGHITLISSPLFIHKTQSCAFRVSPVIEQGKNIIWVCG